MKIIVTVLLSLCFFQYCSMESREYEFVTIKNNSNIPLACILWNESKFDQFKYADRMSEVSIKEYGIDKMYTTQTRQDIFKKMDDVVFGFFPIYIYIKPGAADSLINYPQEFALKISKYTKSELEALNWTITYP